MSFLPTPKLIAIFTLAIASGQLAVTPAHSQVLEQPDAKADRLASQFSKHYIPLETTLEAALQNYDQQFRRAAAKDNSYQKLEKRHPGLLEAAMAAGRSIVAKDLGATIPIIQEKLAAFALDKFSSSELMEVNGFYESSTGQAIMRGVLENSDTDQLTDKLNEDAKANDGRFVINDEDIVAFAGEAAIKSMSNADIEEFVRFLSTPAGRKFMANAEGFVGIVSAEMTKSVNAYLPLVQAATMQTVRDFISGKRTK